ncbi:SdrD B-like domain-containing protein, partial [Microcoleus sp. CAWBG50]
MEVYKERKHQIVFADSQVKDCESLTKTANSDTEVIILKADRDGIAQIAETLKQRQNIAAVHILSHGSAASLQLGSTELNLSNIETYRNYLEKWFALPAAEANSNSSTTAKPEILLYGCNVAATEAGVAFVQRLSQLTGANIAASDNLTGSAALGGDWVLEVTTGKIETPLAFSQEAREAYSGVLIPLTLDVNNFSELDNAIKVANTNDGPDTINIKSNFTLTGLLPRITGPTNIVGGGFKITGTPTARAFVVDSTGPVNISNLTIDSATAVGGIAPAGGGGGGAAGLGGALFINSGTVIVDRVTFSNNQAIGGAGAAGIGGKGGTADFGGVPFGGSPGVAFPTAATAGGSFTPNGNPGNNGSPGFSAGAPAGNGGAAGAGGNGVGPAGVGGIGGIGGAGVSGSIGGGGGAGGAGGNGGTGATTNGGGGTGGAGGAGGFGGGGGAGGTGGTSTPPALAGVNGAGGVGGFGGGGGAGATPGLSTAINLFTPGGTAVAAAGGGGAGLGGAIFVGGGNLTLTNSTLYSNTVRGGNAGAATAGAGTAAGGSIFVNFGATATLTNNTIAYNSATAATVGTPASLIANGGGIYNNGGTVTVKNTIVAGNTATTNPDVTGAFTGNNNLIGVLGTSTGLTGQALAVPLATVLAPAAAAGLNGATAPAPFTLALVSNPVVTTSTNPAIGGGDPTITVVGTTAFDQRGTGFPRKIDNTLVGKPTIDIGAYEYGPVVQGQKFNDINGDGVKAATDPGLGNFTITAGTPTSTTSVTTAVSSSVPATLGQYTLTDTKANTAIAETLPPGWVQTVGPTPPSTGTADVPNANFGNFLKTTIAGKTFSDLAGNGFTPDDTALAGVVVNLYRDTNGDGIFQAATDTVVGTPQTTTATGDYSFADIGPGKYLIQAVPPASSSISFPAGTNPAIAVTTESGKPVVGQNFGIFKNVTITGQKFNDLNGNGVKEGTEPGLEGWKILLEPQTFIGTAVPRSTTTDASGNYTFTDVGAGTFLLREEQKTGWQQTFPVPPAATRLTTASGVNIANTTALPTNFGNFQVGKISGIKFNDRNKNGVQDAGEPALAGWRIYLDANNNGTLEPTETATVTDITGKYQFNDLPFATYNVRELVEPGWTQIAPAASGTAPTLSGAYRIALTSGQDSQNNNFGNFFEASTISGQKFNDLNNNGVKDAGELGLQNWQIFIDTSKDGVFQQGELTTITDKDGNYTINDVPVGTHQVREVQQTGWTLTTALPADVVIAKAGEKPTGIDFGNFLPQPGQIRGLKFQDNNRNGVQDAGEPGLPNVQIQLTKVVAPAPGAPVAVPVTTTTDNSGNYLFANLAPATYRVREIAPVGFTQSSPNPADIVLASGAIVSGINFGNSVITTPTPSPTPTPTPEPPGRTSPTPTPAPTPTPTPAPPTPPTPPT